MSALIGQVISCGSLGGSFYDFPMGRGHVYSEGNWLLELQHTHSAYFSILEAISRFLFFSVLRGSRLFSACVPQRAKCKSKPPFCHFDLHFYRLMDKVALTGSGPVQYSLMCYFSQINVCWECSPSDSFDTAQNLLKGARSLCFIQLHKTTQLLGKQEDGFELWGLK